MPNTLLDPDKIVDRNQNKLFDSSIYNELAMECTKLLGEKVKALRSGDKKMADNIQKALVDYSNEMRKMLKTK